MNARSDAAVEIPAEDQTFDFETSFRAHFERIARVIARVVQDPARAEELAVEVFIKLWRNPRAQGDKSEGWLYRAAVRKGLDELRLRTRRARYEGLFRAVLRAPTPEEVYLASGEQQRVRQVLAALDSRKSELLVLRSDGLNYQELAAALDLNPASVGTLLSRAQQAFRKEYIQRYGPK